MHHWLSIQKHLATIWELGLMLECPITLNKTVPNLNSSIFLYMDAWGYAFAFRKPIKYIRQSLSFLNHNPNLKINKIKAQRDKRH